MNSLLPYRWIGIGLIVLSLLAIIGRDQIVIAGLRTKIAEGAAAFSDYRREAATAARAGEAAARAEERRTATIIQEALDERELQLARERADRVIADAAAGRLQQRYAAALAASRAASGSSTAAGGSAPEPAADLPADLFGGLLEVARQYRDAAEDAITRGELAERSYDALRPSTLTLPAIKLSAPPHDAL